jgi:hypothetical protein
MGDVPQADFRQDLRTAEKPARRGEQARPAGFFASGMWEIGAGKKQSGTTEVVPLCWQSQRFSGCCALS